NATSKIEKGGLLSESANRVDHGAGRLLGDVFQLWVLGAEHAPGRAKQMRGDRGHQRSERCFVAALDVSRQVRKLVVPANLRCRHEMKEFCDAAQHRRRSSLAAAA